MKPTELFLQCKNCKAYFEPEDNKQAICFDCIYDSQALEPYERETE